MELVSVTVEQDFAGMFSDLLNQRPTETGVVCEKVKLDAALVKERQSLIRFLYQTVDIPAAGK